MKRQEYNKKILEICPDFYPEFKEEVVLNIDLFPDQRFGQLICNYICPDYRDSEVSNLSIVIMNTLFSDWRQYDPFFEESSETFKRLSKKYGA